VRERAAGYGPVVVDASLAVKWFAREPGSEMAAALLAGAQALVAPDIMPLEVANALWKKVQRQDVAPDDVAPALTRLLGLDVVLSPTVDLLQPAVRMALEIVHPVYDCVYLVLAEERGAPIASADIRLRQAARARGLRLWKEAPTG
jgi:predicted nucleic acid-binding protein